MTNVAVSSYQLLGTAVAPTADNAGSVMTTVRPDGSGEIVVDHPTLVGRALVPCEDAGPWSTATLADIVPQVLEVLAVRGSAPDDGWGRGVITVGRRLGRRRIFTERVVGSRLRQPPRFDLSWGPATFTFAVNGFRRAWFFTLLTTEKAAADVGVLAEQVIA